MPAPHQSTTLLALLAAATLELAAGPAPCPLPDEGVAQCPDGASGVVSSSLQRAADRVTFTEDAFIGRVRWWGGYAFGPPTPFRITLYPDDDGVPDVAEGVVLYEGEGNPAFTGDVFDVPGLVEIEEIVYAADVAFFVEAGDACWIEVYGTSPMLTLWAWQSASGGDGDARADDLSGDWDTVVGFDLAIAFTTTDLCADTNGDGRVDLSDLNVVLTFFGLAVDPGSPGDFDGNGIVDIADVNLLLTQWNLECSLG